MVKPLPQCERTRSRSTRLGVVERMESDAKLGDAGRFAVKFGEGIGGPNSVQLADLQSQRFRARRVPPAGTRLLVSIQLHTAIDTGEDR
ncbi:hypothetical protein GCM10010470_55660 [Saccharopolyspora taberi]|uniref:Uncharacterized protein n=1 Tax=Saccharopolyspora taberi TaxID=60895 RepID=A0ABN3VKC2_9PSEU